MNKADEQLPLWANGRLPEAERQRLEQALKDDPKLAHEADFMKALRSGLQSPPDETPPGELGLARLKRDIAHNRAPQPVRRRANLWKPLALAASVMVAIQAGLLIGSDPWRAVRDTNLAPASGKVTISGPRLQIVFDGSTSVSDMQVMLQAVNARLVDGPGALGIWTLELPEGADVQVVRERLQSSQGVAEVIAL